MKNSTDHIEQALDDALYLTFPASDPVAVFLTTTSALAGHEALPYGGMSSWNRDRRISG